MKKSGIYIFVGHFGSGKTETAVNFALKNAEKGESVTLIDIDIVNPFYRSSELREMLEQKGIRVISPNFVGTTSDVPSLPPSIQGVFSGNEGVVVFDVGGDPTGATALSRYKDYFERTDYEMLLVVNTYRPLTSTKDGIMEYMAMIEKHSRLHITHLVCNSNLSYETTLPMVLEGVQEVRKVSELTQVPIKYINLPVYLKEELPEEFRSKEFLLELFMTKWNH